MPGLLDYLGAGMQSLGNGGSLWGAMTGNYTDPQPPGSSIGVGDYQMPRMGDAGLYNPQQQPMPSPQFGNPDGLVARLMGSGGGNPDSLFSRLSNPGSMASPDSIIGRLSNPGGPQFGNPNGLIARIGAFARRP